MFTGILYTHIFYALGGSEMPNGQNLRPIAASSYSCMAGDKLKPSWNKAECIGLPITLQITARVTWGRLASGSSLAH